MAILSIPASCQYFRCPSRWTLDSVNGKCYLVTKDSANWDDARRSCSELGGGLAIFKNEQESEFVKDNLDLTSNIWIGLKNLNSEWIWVDGTTAAFTEWAHFQPSIVFDEPLSSKNCVEMRRLKKYLWRNRLCTTLNRALCERYAAESTLRYTCPEKWFHNFEVCYHISTERVSYEEAAKKCPSLAVGSKFFAPRDSVENNFIADIGHIGVCSQNPPVKYELHKVEIKRRKDQFSLDRNKRRGR
ncbi:Antigen-like protein E [Armadillidium vulgare]|nr:Antigen-like protein E [Armadillidium vulgare]